MDERQMADLVIIARDWWRGLGGGEAGYVYIDPSNSEVYVTTVDEFTDLAPIACLVYCEGGNMYPDKRTMHKFSVGDGCTYNVGSDRYAGTVIAVSPSGKTITVQDDSSKRIDKNGLSEMQEYEYSRNPQGAIQTARWSEKRQGFCNGSSRFGPGRREYRDPHV